MAVAVTLNASAVNGAAGSAGCLAAYRRHVGRCREVRDDGVEERLGATVAVGRAAEDDHGLAGEGEVAERARERLRGERVRRAELVQSRRVQLRHRLLQASPAVPGLVPEPVGDRQDGVRVGAVGPHVRPHPDQVHDAGEAVLAPDRQLHGERDGAEPRTDRLHGAVEVRARAVELVDERDARDAVPVRLPPHRLALRLDARDGVEDGDGAVEDAQRALDLVGEVDVTRCVDQVDPVVSPVAADGRGEDRDAPVPLLRVEVGDGRAVVDLAALVDGTGEEEDPLGDGGLARVDVGEDAEVADDGREVRTHGVVPFAAAWRTGQRDSRTKVRCVTSSRAAMAGAQPPPLGGGGEDHVVPGTGGGHGDGTVAAHGLLPSVGRLPTHRSVRRDVSVGRAAGRATAVFARRPDQPRC